MVGANSLCAGLSSKSLRLASICNLIIMEVVVQEMEEVSEGARQLSSLKKNQASFSSMSTAYKYTVLINENRVASFQSDLESCLLENCQLCGAQMPSSFTVAPAKCGHLFCKNCCKKKISGAFQKEGVFLGLSCFTCGSSFLKSAEV